MPEISAQIMKTHGERLPLKVVFRQNDTVIAEHPVPSQAGGERLVAELLPLLRKHENG